MSHARAVRRMVIVLGLAVAAVVSLTGIARPGTVPAAGGPAVRAATGGVPAASAAAPTIVKGIWDQTPYKLYEQNDRVDPFTRGKPKQSELPIGDTVRPEAPSEAVAKVLGKSLKAYGEAEALLVSDRKERYTLCAEACQRGAQELRQTIADIGKEDALAKFVEPARALMERFARLEATSKRLKQRQDVEAEFVSLKITVDGIVWNEQSPAAAVNGQVAGEGSVLKLGAAGQEVQVYRIRRDAVVFVYKGVQVSVRLDRGGL